MGDPIQTQGGIDFHHVAATGQVDLAVKDMLTRPTRHGLAARLQSNVNVERAWKVDYPWGFEAWVYRPYPIADAAT